ncbi:MAG: SDR family NAD(P)-dependent oxidoreductase [Acidobacteria bacterium]|nr:SDR family NAD(P)-dependent oxidoreductase [Acidobacteriota bacterium]
MTSNVDTSAEKLRGRKTMIADGDAGLGREISLAYARGGADIAIGYCGDDPDAAEVTGAIARAGGGRVALLPGDLTDADVCADVLQRAVQHLDGLDTLIALERPVLLNLSRALRALSLPGIRLRSLAALPR